MFCDWGTNWHLWWKARPLIPKTYSSTIHAYHTIPFSDKEERQCSIIDLPRCPAQCPEFKLVRLLPQPNKTIRFQAEFEIGQVNYIPFGKYLYQELQLKVLNDETGIQGTLYAIKIMPEEINETQKISDLQKDTMFEPTIIVYGSMNITRENDINSKVTRFSYNCTYMDKVYIIFFLKYFEGIFLFI